MFMVGTQSLKYTNQIHLLHLDEDTGALNKQVGVETRPAAETERGGVILGENLAKT